MKASGKSTVNVKYVVPQKSEKVKEDKTPQLIDEIHSDLSKSRLFDVLIKCIRLGNLLGSEKDLFWLQNEAYGFDRNKEKIKEKDIPDYRIVNTEIRVKSSDPAGYTSLPYKLTLGHPIWQVEEWVDDAKKHSQDEIVLTAEVTPTLRRVHKEVFGANPPQDKVPYIIRLNDLKKVLAGLKIRISEFLNRIEKSSSSQSK